MFGSNLRRTEDATLSAGLAYSCHFQSQSFEIACDKTLIAKWSIGKIGFISLAIRDVIYVTKAIKGQTMANFLAEHPDLRSIKLYEDLPDEMVEVCMTQTSFEEQIWQLFFDGALRMGPTGNIIAGVGVLLVSPQNYMIPHVFLLTEPIDTPKRQIPKQLFNRSERCLTYRHL